MICKDLHDFAVILEGMIDTIEDARYDVRGTAQEDDEWAEANPGKSAWDHPDVEEWMEGCKAIKAFIEHWKEEDNDLQGEEPEAG